MSNTALNPDVELPPDETPAARCQYCDRPFQSERACALHLGEVHEADLTADERTAYEEALEAERDDLFYFHLKVVVALGFIYAILVLFYMVALGGGFL